MPIVATCRLSSSSSMLYFTGDRAFCAFAERLFADFRADHARRSERADKNYEQPEHIRKVSQNAPRLATIL